MSTEDPRHTPGAGWARAKAELGDMVPDLTEEDERAADALLANLPARRHHVTTPDQVLAALEVLGWPDDRERSAHIEEDGHEVTPARHYWDLVTTVLDAAAAAYVPSLLPEGMTEDELVERFRQAMAQPQRITVLPPSESEREQAAYERGVAEGRRLRAEQLDFATRGAYEDGKGDGRAEGRRQATAFIANEIRAELVCCDVYDRLSPVLDAAEESGSDLMAEVTDENTGGHGICYWGEAAARIAEGRNDAEEAPDA